MLREKPFPADPYSLPQAYQRWLYEDYAYLWRQQSEATRRAYAADGVRFHLTGFQYWMKYQLNNLPGIEAWYRFDSIPTATIPDFSKNFLHPTVYGATSAPGVISRSLYFDGLNDAVVAPLALTTLLPSSYSFEILVSSASPAAFKGIAGWQLAPTWPNLRFFLYQRFGAYLFAIGDGVNSQKTIGISLATTDWTHIYAQWSAPTLTIYSNGILVYSADPAFTPDITGVQFSIGGYFWGAPYFWDGYADNPFVFSRLLDSTEILRHSLRRYPV